jgi:F-type H+-transporting ATPase subunit b
MNFNLTLIMQAVSFTAFIWFCALHLATLMRAIETRQKQIADGLAAGRRTQELANAEKRIADMLTESKAKSAEIVATGERFKSETIEQAKIEAKAEGDRTLPRPRPRLNKKSRGPKNSCAMRSPIRGSRRREDPAKDVDLKVQRNCWRS